MGILHTFRPKTKPRTYDELVRAFLDTTLLGLRTSKVDGSYLYMHTDPSTKVLTVSYGDKSFKVEPFMFFERVNGEHKQIIEHAVVTFYDYHNTRAENISQCMNISIVDSTVHMCTKVTDGYNTAYDMSVPFEMLNEIDFFQYELLNPKVPLGTKEIVRLTLKLIEEMKKCVSPLIM